MHSSDWQTTINNLSAVIYYHKSTFPALKDGLNYDQSSSIVSYVIYLTLDFANAKKEIATTLSERRERKPTKLSS